MTALTPTGMNSTGQFCIAGPNDSIGINGSNYVAAIFTATADATITNTTSELSGLGTGIGTKTLTANSTVIGRTIRIEGSGVYSAAVVSPGTLTIKIKLGSTVLASTVLGAIVSGASNLGFQFEADFTFRTIGGSGTVVTAGSINYASNALGARLFGDLNNSGSSATVDTTVDQAIDVTVTWQTASVSNIIKVTNSTIEVLW